ncbi:signal transducer CD24 [Meles meles]|uniref:signal transducer CD24 n=1 Tax=Meles meles TaxID=9662 RepID=UPI001E699E2E|nr:signal transducer CD24 [Meles meles]
MLRGPGSKSAWGKASGAFGAGGGGSSLWVGCRLLAPVRGREKRQDQNPVACGVRAASPRPAGGSPTLRKMRTRDAPQSSHRVADAGAQKTKRVAERARWTRGRAHTLLRARAPQASPADQPGSPEDPPPQSPFLRCRDLRNPEPREPPVPGAPAAVGAGSKAARRAGASDFSFGGPAGRPRSPPCLRPPGASGSPLTPHPVRHAAHRRRRSGHGQSDGGQARTGAAASGAAPTHADLLRSK